MVYAEKFIKRFEQLWKCQYNESIIDPRSCKKMDGKYADRFEHFEERNRFRLCSVESGPKSRTRYKRIQLACYNFLERPNGVFSVSYHFALFGLVVVGLVFAILETMDELKRNSSLMFGTYILEVFLLIVFTSEYILRMWSAGCRSTYSGVLGRLRFAFKPFVIVDMIVIGSTFGVIIYSSNTNNLTSTISMLRFFQVLRMVRFDRQGSSWKLLGSVLFLHRQELLTTFYIGFCSLIFASFFVYQAEHVDNALEFETFADSFWWGVVTLTTVGYGDKVPRSWAGRGVAAFFAIMGISFFALPAGILGSGFALKVSKQQRQKHVKRRRRPAAMLIQCNWRYYASRKNSKLNATWSPYIKYLQEKNSKNDNHRISEKTSQPRVRKISIFGRKASGLSSDGFSRPAGSTTPEQVRQRSEKVIRSELFQSNESLQDCCHSNSTADQHTDDEHGGSHVRHKPILVSDNHGNPSLPAAYKQSIRFTRYLKFLVALRKFKLAKRPYDVKDVIEQYSTGHVEVLGKVKSIGHKIDEALGYNAGTAKVNENAPSRTNVVHRLSRLEKQVKTLENKLDLVISLLEDTKRKEVVPSSVEDRLPCSVCEHSNSHHSEQRYSEASHQKPVRKRKLGATLSNQSNDSLCERPELRLNQEDASLKSSENLDHCLENNNHECSLKTEDVGLSPIYGYLDDNDVSCQSSRYGISDNCPSPNPSSSDESYQSKDMLNHDGQKCSMLPSDNPLCGESFPEQGIFVEIPISDLMLPELFDKQKTSGVEGEESSENRESIELPNYGASDKVYLGINRDSCGKELPRHGCIAGETFASPATVPLIPDNDTGVNQYIRIPGLIYQSPQDYISEPDLSDVSKSQSPWRDGELVKADGHEKERYVEDKLVSEHGQVYENYDPECSDSLPEKSNEDNHLRQEERVMQASLEQRSSSTAGSCDNLYVIQPREHSAFVSVDSVNKKPDEQSLETSIDSELSNRSTVERSHDSDVPPGSFNKRRIQETRM